MGASGTGPVGAALKGALGGIRGGALGGVLGGALASALGVLGRGRPGTSPSSGAPILILGMHRSGTSFLAGSLQAAGLALDGASTWDKHNRKGNRERRDLMEMHEAMLVRRGHSWRAPPAGPVAWTAEERGAALALVAAASASGHPWGFKDPRTLLLAEGWLDLFPAARPVGIFRHPSLVAASLKARSRIGRDDAYALWAAYNRRLLALHDRAPFPILSFDEPGEALRARLDALLPSLGLAPPPEPFFDPELRHHDAPPGEVHPSLRDLWAALEARR